MRTNRFPTSPRWKRSTQAAYDFIIEYGVHTLPFDIHKALLSRGHSVKTYSELSTKSNTSLEEVCESFASADGVSHYHPKRNKYAVCYNDRVTPAGRIKWTLAHELGHITLGHLVDFPQTGIEHAALKASSYSILESEANVFARELLAPSSVLIYIAERYRAYHDPLCFYTVARSIFRLSMEASYYIAIDLARNYNMYVLGQPHLGGIHVAEVYGCCLHGRYLDILSDMDLFSAWLNCYRYEFNLLSYLGLGRDLERTHPGLRSISEAIFEILSALTPPPDDRS